MTGQTVSHYKTREAGRGRHGRGLKATDPTLYAQVEKPESDIMLVENFR